MQITPGLHFKDGTSSFVVMGPVDGKPNLWFVRHSMPGVMSVRPRTITMTSEKITMYRGNYTADIALKDFQNQGFESGASKMKRSTIALISRIQMLRSARAGA